MRFTLASAVEVFVVRDGTSFGWLVVLALVLSAALAVADLFFSRWLRYRRRRDTLAVLQAYVTQGRDPPPELLRALQTPSPPYRQRQQSWTSVAIMGSLSIAFGIMAFLDRDDLPKESHGLLFAAIILAALAVAAVVTAISESRLKVDSE